MHTFNWMRLPASRLMLLFLLLSSGLTAQTELYIGSGDTITVLPGTVIHVDSILTGPGFLSLEADASGYAQLSQAQNAANTGSIVLKKRLSSTSAAWRQMGFPFTGTFGDLTFNSTMPFIHSTNNGGIPARQNFYSWNATDAGLDSAAGWEVIEEANTLPSAASVYLANNGIHDFSQVIQVSGTPQNGDVSFSLHYTIDPSFSAGIVTDATGWNFIPNPYPSNISVSQLFMASGFPTYEALHVWDVNAGQYVAVIPSGIAVNYNTSTSDNVTTHISPMEGFWVKADPMGNTLTLTNAIRDVEGSATAFMKTAPELLRLNLINSAGAMDQAVVYFDDLATPHFDNGLEALKRKGNSNTPQLSVQSSNQRLAITALSYGDHSLTLSIDVPEAGATYSFELDTDEFDPWSSVELEDTHSGILYDLRSTRSVPIQLLEVSYPDRFILHINKSRISIEEQRTESTLTAWQNAQGYLVIRSRDARVETVNIISVDGRIVATGEVEEDGELILKDLLSPGVYILKESSSNSVPQKIILY